MGRWLVEHDMGTAAAPAASTSGMDQISAMGMNSTSGNMGMAPGGPPIQMNHIMMMMQMSFELSDHVTLWLKSWHISSPWIYTASCVGLFVLCLLQEALTSYRSHFAGSKMAEASMEGKQGWQHANQQSDGRDSLASSMNGFDGIAGHLSSMQDASAYVFRDSSSVIAKLWLSMLYGINLTLAYLLMLAVMTFNVGYFIVIVVGLSTGHFFFFRWQQSMSDVCHAQPGDL